MMLGWRDWFIEGKYMLFNVSIRSWVHVYTRNPSRLRLVVRRHGHMVNSSSQLIAPTVTPEVMEYINSNLGRCEVNWYVWVGENQYHSSHPKRFALPWPSSGGIEVAYMRTSYGHAGFETDSWQGVSTETEHQWWTYQSTTYRFTARNHSRLYHIGQCQIFSYTAYDDGTSDVLLLYRAENTWL